MPDCERCDGSGDCPDCIGIDSEGCETCDGDGDCPECEGTGEGDE
jgi:hypothetical protein